MTIRTADQRVVVDSPLAAGRTVERVIHETGGFLEQSSGSKDGNVRIVGRTPVAQLDSVMGVAAALGVEKRRIMAAGQGGLEKLKHETIAAIDAFTVNLDAMLKQARETFMLLRRLAPKQEWREVSDAEYAEKEKTFEAQRRERLKDLDAMG